jgi:hypothetical protein
MKKLLMAFALVFAALSVNAKEPCRPLPPRPIPAPQPIPRPVPAPLPPIKLPW